MERTQADVLNASLSEVEEVAYHVHDICRFHDFVNSVFVDVSRHELCCLKKKKIVCDRDNVRVRASPVCVFSLYYPQGYIVPHVVVR